jgi:formyltetrahydrofolate deformylase
MTSTYVLSLSCEDRPGLVAKVAGFLAEQGGNITEAQQYNDPDTEQFFMRVEFDPGAQSALAYRDAFAPIAETAGMTWKLRASDELKKVVLIVSKFDHCLGDLLYRNRIGELAMDVVAIIANHPREVLTTSLIGDITV